MERSIRTIHRKNFSNDALQSVPSSNRIVHLKVPWMSKPNHISKRIEKEKVKFILRLVKSTTFFANMREVPTSSHASAESLPKKATSKCLHSRCHEFLLQDLVTNILTCEETCLGWLAGLAWISYKQSLYVLLELHLPLGVRFQHIISLCHPR